jgi:ribokinase
MTRPRIVVLGSANMDLVVTVPSAPGRGETVTGTSFHTGPGGKGANQAIAARRAGADVTFLGAVGDDEYGARIRTLLAADGVDVSGLTTSDQPTGTAHIVVDNAGENSIIVVPGANGTMRSLTAEHRDRIAAADVLLLQLELPLEVVAQAARFARANGVWTVLTPAPARELPPEVLASVELLVPNQHEATALTGTVDPDEAGRSLQQRSGQVLITLGTSGPTRSRSACPRSRCRPWTPPRRATASSAPSPLPARPARTCGLRSAEPPRPRRSPSAVPARRLRSRSAPRSTSS